MIINILEHSERCSNHGLEQFHLPIQRFTRYAKVDRVKRLIYSLSPESAFLAAFFLLFLFFLEPVDLDRGRSRILRISSSSIFLSDLTLVKSGAAGAVSLVIPFLVIATYRSVKRKQDYGRKGSGGSSDARL